MEFDQLATLGLNSLDKKEQAKEAIEQFKEFRNQSVPKEVAAYTWAPGEVLIKVFKYTPGTKTNIQINASGDTSELNNVRYFSVAKVLASGPESKYSVNDIVKLRDTDTLSIESSKYKTWVDNPMSKSNLKQKGEEPQRFISNIFKTLGPQAFILNPFDLENLDAHVDDAVYKISERQIENPVANVEVLFDCI